MAKKICILLSTLVLLLALYYQIEIREKFETMPLRALCLVTFQPNEIWCDFLDKFVVYSVFVVVDDNSFDLTEWEEKYRNIKFVQVDEQLCENAGFVDVNYTLRKRISGWDKALYYFCMKEIKKELNFDFVWMLEDDVFLSNESTLLSIDNIYVDDDLLSRKSEENSDGNQETWLWKKILETGIHFDRPYYHGLMCAVRFSRHMFNSIAAYASDNHKLVFLEVLFPTLANKNKLKYSTPPEFNMIHYRHDFTKEQVQDTSLLYHPVKNINHHLLFRQT